MKLKVLLLASTEIGSKLARHALAVGLADVCNLSYDELMKGTYLPSSTVLLGLER